MARIPIPLAVLCLILAGCQSAPTAQPTPTTQPATAPAERTKPTEPAIAFINSQPLTWADLHTAMVEAAGGQAVVELVLERGVQHRLEDRNLKLTPELIAQEQKVFTDAFSSDPDQAQRLLNELRIRRGLGEQRYKSLLARNAGLRLLVQDQVKISDTLIQQAYDNRYGPRYEARIIVVETFSQAGEVVKKAKAGESFIDMAIKLSTDSSRAQGGLMPPISPADPTYPQAVREALTALQPGRISDPVALERGFAVLQLVRKIEGPAVKFDDVKEALSRGVRRQVEEMHMSQLARAIITEADVVVLDPTLERSWSQQKKRTTP